MATDESLKEVSTEIGKSCVCFHMRRTARLLSQAYDQALKPTGLKVTQFSLMTTVAADEGATIGRLAGLLGMDRTTLSRSARLLAKRVDQNSRGGRQAGASINSYGKGSRIAIRGNTPME